MITVLKIDKEKLSYFYNEAGLVINGNSMGVCAENRGEVLAFCLFDLFEKGIDIRYINPENDIALADGVLRSALHIAAEHSAMDAHYTDTVNEKLLESLEFILDKADKTLNIDKLFGGCCCGKK